MSRISLLVAWTACASAEVPRECIDAEERFAACELSTPAGFGALWRAAPESVTEVLELPCDQLAKAIDQLGKSDLPGFDRGEGQPCVFNIQCDSTEGLFCRPLASTEGVSSLSVPHQCLLYGMNGDFCD